MSKYLLYLENKGAVEKWEDVDSFFSMFKTLTIDDPESEADVTQEEEEAEFVKDDLLPYALNYFLNIMPVDDDCGDSCDEEDEDDDHHDHDHKKKGKGGKKEEAKEKCKNQ